MRTLLPFLLLHRWSPDTPLCAMASAPPGTAANNTAQPCGNYFKQKNKNYQKTMTQ